MTTAGYSPVRRTCDFSGVQCIISAAKPLHAFLDGLLNSLSLENHFRRLDSGRPAIQEGASLGGVIGSRIEKPITAFADPLLPPFGDAYSSFFLAESLHDPHEELIIASVEIRCRTRCDRESPLRRALHTSCTSSLTAAG